MNVIINALKKALQEKQSFKIEQLGWFSVHQESAKVDTSKHSFTPPAHQIIFSQKELPVSLDFEAFLSEELKISVSEAQSQSAAFAEQVLHSLKETGKYDLEGLGEMVLQGRKIFFRMDTDSELNAEFFGLEKFTMRPAKLRKYPQAKKSKKTSKRWLWFLIILILLGGAGVGGYFYKDVLCREFETLKLKYFDKAPVVQDTLQIEVVPPDIVQEENFYEEDTVTEEPIVETIVQEERFYLIAGCFKSEENAQKLIKQLENKGFSPKLLGQTSQGLYRVALNEGYATKDEALQMIIQHSDCWILKH